MPDQQHPPPQLAPTETRAKNSPPLTPPDTGLGDADQKQSRKREREVSLEPVNTPKTSDTDGAGATESRETRTPAKRNKRALESTKEEIEDGAGKAASRSRSRSHSVSPPLAVGVSPHQEIKIKVRQISRGVEYLSWKTPEALDENQQAQEIIVSSTLAPPAEVDEKTSEVEDAVITDVKDNNSQPPVQQEVEDKDTARRAEGTDNGAASASVAPVAHVYVRSQPESQEKGLKRRYEDRGTSQGPNEEEGTSKIAPETSKRPRDDGDEDPNPRETKRPSPPPETKKSSPKSSPPPSKAVPKLSGFEAYASISPFAAARGPNIFASGKNTPASIFDSPVPSTPLSTFTSATGEISSSSPKGLKRSGFEAFALSSSPFSPIARSKSPILGQTPILGSRTKSPTGGTNSVNSNPFGQYTGLNQVYQGLGAPTPKRARAGSPPESSQGSQEKTSAANVLNTGQTQSSEEEEENDERETSFEEKLRAVKDEEESDKKEASFGEKLRAAKDEDEDSNRSEDDAKVRFTERQEGKDQVFLSSGKPLIMMTVVTGEEEEDTIYHVRSKLFSLENGQWKERGTGLLKLNVKRSDGTGARLVMRKDVVYTLLLNVMLFHGMVCTLVPQDPRYLRLSAIENGSTTHYNLRLANAKAAQDLLKKILINIPPA